MKQEAFDTGLLHDPNVNNTFKHLRELLTLFQTFVDYLSFCCKALKQAQSVL